MYCVCSLSFFFYLLHVDVEGTKGLGERYDFGLGYSPFSTKERVYEWICEAIRALDPSMSNEMS
jgi:hypothetical protein